MVALHENLTSLRVALVHIWAPPFVDNRASGLVYGFENLGRDLANVGFRVNYVCFSNKKANGDWHPLFTHVAGLDADILNKFDFIIFGSAGSMTDKKDGPWWKTILEGLKVPFVIQVNNEVDQQLLIYKDFFYDHPYFAFGMPITEGLCYKSTPNRDNLRNLVYECLPRTDLAHPEIFYGQKVDQVVTSCRMTSRKRILELVRQAETLYMAGFETHIHGADATWFYVKELKELQSQYWTYHGSFRRNQLPEILGPARFHYNCCYLKKGVVTPRIETSTVEGASYGCCPILSRSTVPEWVTDDMAILVDTNDMTHLAERLNATRNQAHKMNARFWQGYKENIGRAKLDLLAETITNMARSKKSSLSE